MLSLCVCVLSYCRLICVWEAAGGGRREEEEEKEKEPGIQNQKQEPHTKMWGKRRRLGENDEKGEND